jgi:hypothetical protein
VIRGLGRATPWSVSRRTTPTAGTLRTGLAGACLLGASLSCQPLASIEGDVWVPKWVEGFDTRNLHVHVDTAPDRITLANLARDGIASAPVGHESGISIYPRYAPGFESRIELTPAVRNVGYTITVSRPAAVVELRLWLDVNGNGIVDRGDLEGRPRGRVVDLADPGLFSCGAAGATAPPILWQTLEK